MAAKTKKEYVYAVGRRRTASARVRVHKGTEESTVNGVVIGKYFGAAFLTSLWQKPFTTTNTIGKYYVTAKVSGGGKQGQLTAVMHGISRALAATNEAFREPLKAADLLTRDSRIRQRRHVGTGGKARRKKSSPKR
ncbi:30S ribosomal protein S9 [Candidatus Woesebacteria bacterium]|jgi:small subunit ribosomal protein S9|nr:30S ribosomal protein S9 [Candidatus Woesebacteria bacterium]MBP9687047.1 30S ribosomal protein S9 [Candidatus Woesebacteria bacterium]